LRFAISILIISFPLLGAPADLIVSGTEYCIPIITIVVPPPSYGIEWRNLWSEISPDDDAGMALIAAGGRGRLLAIETPEFARFNILEVRADQTRTQLFSMDGKSGAGLVADAAGRIFVLASHPGGPSSSIFVLSPDGSLLATHTAAGSTESYYQRIDLASDQCTLYYGTNSGTVRRFDVCTGTQGPDFPAAASNALALLPDGDLLVSYGNHLFRYDPSGLLVRTYVLGESVSSFALTAAGRRAVVVTQCRQQGQVREVDLDSGVETVRDESLTAVAGEVTAIVPVNGWTAALGSAAAMAVSDIPVLGISGVVALAAILALFGLSRLR
jgi:outer membrane protein assembly factor BamB